MPALKEKVEVRDFKDLVAQNREAYRSAIKTVFAMEDVRVQDGAILLIEQPLYRTDYCSDLRYVLFYRRLIRQLAEEGKSISAICDRTGYSYVTVKKYLGR